ncbi:MAG TPA: DUF3995 domain-containing protein [Devosia sp.]|nr:DUF3995 domain-containing protein [Devosia sp.]
MSMIIAAIMFVPLLAIAIATFIWSLGGSWPLRDRAMLPDVVLGIPGTRQIPRLGAFLTSIAVLAAGVAALALADHTGGGPWLTLLGIVLGGAFLTRGAFGYSAWWQTLFSAEPFATLDRKNYSPMCLMIGAGYLILVVLRLI